MATTICMAVYSTKDNGRMEYTKFTLEMLLRTVDFNKHSLIVSDNGSCKEMIKWYENEFTEMVKNSSRLPLKILFLYNKRNLGTAGAINKAIRYARDKYGKGQYIVKADDDIDIIKIGWVDEMEEYMRRDPAIGILGLKRFDLLQSPDNKDWPSKLYMLPRNHGDSWLIGEQADDIIGTCTMLNPKLLDKVGYYEQPGIYGYDDGIICVKSKVLGFKNVFATPIPIRTIDTGDNAFTETKRQWAGEDMPKYFAIRDALLAGTRDVYYEPEWDKLN